MPIDEMSPSAARAAMQADAACAFVDVRTTEEYDRGHPEGALNVPWAVLDEATGRMTPNSRFLPTMQKLFERKRRLFLSCQAGVRSMNACRELEGAGYTTLVSIVGGFGGKRDPMGSLVAKGWVDSGLPVASNRSTYPQQAV